MNTKDTNTIEGRVINDPIGAYIDFYARLKEHGLNAPFPEFKPVVDFLVQELRSDYFKDVLVANPALEYEMNEVLTFLAHVNLKFNTEGAEQYPYEVPFSEPFPYRPTIDAIESAIRLLDKMNRLQPGNKAMKLYHFDRYCYHRHSLVSSQDVVLIPTLDELSLVDFIRTRSVPIEFVGVISKTTRVDGHQQSPLDFWYHDLNHARRLYAYIVRREKQKGITTDMQKLAFYKEVDQFITDVIFPKLIDIPTDASEEEKALRQLATMIIFEIVHETALTLEKDEIVRDLLRPNGPQPFEYMMKKEDVEHESDIEALEAKRTPTGNLESGSSVMGERGAEPIQIKYFFDRASIGLLANVFSKLNHHYYDDEGSVNENVVLLAYRKPEFVVKAAKKILDVFGVTEYLDDAALLELVVNREGTKEKILTKGINEEGEESTQHATDPIFADDAVAQIKALGKKVYTLFGYSALDYEEKDKVFAQIKAELEKLDREEYVISIGATEDGIGGMYEIAKKLGFKTIGIVSTQALTYSGRFSPFDIFLSIKL